MFWTSNATAIKHKNPSLLAVLTQQDPAQTDLQFISTATGDYSLLYEGISLHDPAGAEAEARQILQDTRVIDTQTERTTVYLVFGLGVGYLPQALFDATGSQILIYEPDTALLRFVLEHVDLSELLAASRVELMASPESISQWINRHYMVGDRIIPLSLPNYARLKGVHLAEVMQNHVQRSVYLKQQSLQVVTEYHDDWLRQYLANIKYFHQALPCSLLANGFPDVPALVISAGPSLDEAIPAIKARQDHCVLIAVGGALRVLLAAGVTPDIAVFLDFDGPGHQLAQLPCSTENITFLASLFTQNVCFTAPSRHIYLAPIQTLPEFNQWLYQMAPEFGAQPAFPPAGSVSILAYHTAVSLGCNPIILVGQDLALQGNRFYAGNIEAELDSNTIRLSGSSTQIEKQLAKVTVKGQNGEELTTTSDYQWFLEQFEYWAAQNQNTQQPRTLYNASTGGAWIEGFTHMPLEQVLPDSEINPLQPIDKTLLQQPPTQIPPNQSVFKQALKALYQDIETLIGLNKKTLGYLAVWNPSDQEAYTAFRSEYIQRLLAHPMIHYSLQMETWTLRQHYLSTPPATDPEQEAQRQEQNRQTDQVFFSACLQALEQRYLPMVQQAASLQAF